MNTSEETEKPWERIEAVLSEGDDGAADDLIRFLSAEEQRLAVSRLSTESRRLLLETLSPDVAVELFSHLPQSESISALQEVEPDAAAVILEALPDDLGADLLAGMVTGEAERVLESFEDPDAAEHLREIKLYASDEAGGLMSNRFVSVQAGQSCRMVLNELEERSPDITSFDVQYIYVQNQAGVLVGVLPLRRLVLSKGMTPIEDVMISDLQTLSADTTFEELQDLWEDTDYHGLPVVDSSNHLIGVVERRAILLQQNKQQTDDYLHVSGIVGGEELRSMPMLTRCRRRLTWLAPNIVLNLMAASIIAMHEETLQAVIALAVFLPVISDMSGCSGNQAVAVSIRELTLGLISPPEFRRVLWKEGLLGAINGLVLGIVLGLIAGLWWKNPWLGLVVGGALFLNTLISATFGGLVPLLLKRFKIDPAVASGPILTTCTDMCGFFLVLTFANAMLSRLV